METYVVVGSSSALEPGSGMMDWNWWTFSELVWDWITFVDLWISLFITLFTFDALETFDKFLLNNNNSMEQINGSYYSLTQKIVP